MDTSNLFGNLFDNAVAAVGSMPPKDRWINVTLSNKNRFVYIKVSNSKLNKIIVENNYYLSTKREYTQKGSGMGIIKSVVMQYGGIVNITHTDMSFSCDFCLNIPK